MFVVSASEAEAAVTEVAASTPWRQSGAAVPRFTGAPEETGRLAVTHAVGGNRTELLVTPAPRPAHSDHDVMNAHSMALMVGVSVVAGLFLLVFLVLVALHCVGVIQRVREHRQS